MYSWKTTLTLCGYKGGSIKCIQNIILYADRSRHPNSIQLLFTTGLTRERERWSRLQTHSHRCRIFSQTHTTTDFFHKHTQVQNIFTNTHRYRIFSQTHTSAKYFHKFTQVKNILTNTHNYWIFPQVNTTSDFFRRHTPSDYFCKHT